VGGVDADERRSGESVHRLGVGRDVRSVLLQHLVFVAEPERGAPPRHVVIPRDDDDPTRLLGMPKEDPRALELSGAGTLRQVAGHGDDVESLLPNERLDRLVDLRHGRMTEVEIRDVENRRHDAAVELRDARSRRR
jgi:hypothetical protein